MAVRMRAVNVQAVAKPHRASVKAPVGELLPTDDTCGALPATNSAPSQSRVPTTMIATYPKDQSAF
jgi:hypothetical protein